jgi:Fur family transcriptional regulator, stress-responsive regulator
VTDADQLREAGLRVTTAGLVRRIEPAGSAARYESRTGGNHQHLVCRRCGTVADVDCAAGHTPCLEPLASAGFVIERAEVTFWGLCPSCRALKGGPGESPAQGSRP